MSITADIQRDLMESLKKRDDITSDILRVVLASLKNAKIAKSDGSDLNEEEEVKIVFSEAKKVRDSIEQFGKAGRNDLEKRERAQLKVIEAYLPQQADEEEVRRVVKEVIERTGADSMKQMGMVMGTAMKDLQGKADGKLVNQVVQEELS